MFENEVNSNYKDKKEGNDYENIIQINHRAERKTGYGSERTDREN